MIPSWTHSPVQEPMQGLPGNGEGQVGKNDKEEKSVKRVHSGMTGEKKRTSVHGPCLDNEHGTGFGSTQA